MKYHKRVQRNFHENLQDLIDSSKQTVASGIKSQYKISINHIRLNRATSLAYVFWQLNMVTPDMMPDDLLDLLAREDEVNAALKIDEANLKQGESLKTPVEKLRQIEMDKIDVIEAEV